MIATNPMARKVKKRTGTHLGEGFGLGFGGGTYRFRFDFDLGMPDIVAKRAAISL